MFTVEQVKLILCHLYNKRCWEHRGTWNIIVKGGGVFRINFLPNELVLIKLEKWLKERTYHLKNNEEIISKTCNSTNLIYDFSIVKIYIYFFLLLNYCLTFNF